MFSRHTRWLPNFIDEATAFADPDNEVRVQQALSTLSKGKTVIMIAHRLSSITDADCIYVLQDGEVVESGTHSGLIKRNFDKRLYRLRCTGYILYAPCWATLLLCH